MSNESPGNEKLDDANRKALKFELSFKPKDTDADDSEVRTAADDLGTFAMRILGRSDDLGGKFDEIPQDFTEAVAWDIRDQGNYNNGLWTDTVYAINFSQHETQSWADEVEEFLDDRKKLIDEWDTAVEDAISRKNDLIDDAEVPDALSGQERVDFKNGIKSGAIETAKSVLQEDLADLNTRANNLHQDFQDAAEAHGDRLAEGPTPDNVERLINAGYMNWSGFNIKGDEAPLPLTPERAERDAQQLGQYLGEDAKDIDLDYHEALTLLQSLNAGSFAFQNSKANDAAIEYLEKLYDDLENQAGPTGLPQYLGGSENLSGTELRPLADGILTLSDTEKGGSFGSLPQSIQNVALGPGHGEIDHGDDDIPYGITDYQNDVPDFARLMGASDPDLQGGYGFSVNMTSSIGGHLDLSNGDVSNDLESSLGRLLDVSTRNEDANHGILTGKGGQHPSIDQEDIIAGLFTHDWNDDGKSAANLVEWIHEDACDPQGKAEGTCNADSAEHKRAGDAYHGLIESITAGDLEERLRSTGIEVDGVEDSAFTRVNPYIGESLTSNYIAFLDDITIQTDSDDGYGQITGDQRRASPFHDKDDNGEEPEALKLTGDQKRDLLQFLVADEEQAVRVSAHTQGQEQRLMGATMDGDAEVEHAASQGGELRGVLDGALFNEYNEQLEDKHEARAQTRTALEAGRVGLNTAVAGLGGPLGSGAAMGVGTYFNDPIVENAVDMLSGDPTDSDNYSIPRDELGDAALVDRVAVKDHVALQAGNAVVDREEIDASHFEKFDPNLINQDGELAQTIWELESSEVGSRTSRASDIRHIITGYSESDNPPEEFNEIPSTEWKNAPSGGDLDYHIEKYQEHYGASYDDYVNLHDPADDENDTN